MTAPDLTFYRIVHRAIRGGATTIAETAPVIASADQRQRTAYAKYWKGYAGEVLHHHSVEDDIFFPALVERVPMAAQLMVRTDADHHHLDELMAAVDAAVEDIRNGGPAPHIAALTRELDEHMGDHLDFEDDDILPLFERHFEKADYEATEARAVKSAGLGPQMAFSVPMIVGAMTPDERADILGAAALPLRAIYRFTRKGHARLTDRAFGRTLVEAR